MEHETWNITVMGNAKAKHHQHTTITVMEHTTQDMISLIPTNFHVSSNPNDQLLELTYLWYNKLV